MQEAVSAVSRVTDASRGAFCCRSPKPIPGFPDNHRIEGEWPSRRPALLRRRHKNWKGRLMATIVGGFDTGLADTSLFLLNRNDRTRAGVEGHEEEFYVNVSNGNLMIRQVDAFLPSQGEDTLVMRTYNSRGSWNANNGQGWAINTIVLNLSQITANKITLVNPDSSQFVFFGDSAGVVFRSTDGSGAYETIVQNKTTKTWILTRSDQTVLTFDVNGDLIQSQDTNGNLITYVRKAGKLTQVKDDTGHVTNYIYSGSNLSQITDETGAVLVSYVYGQGLLGQVTDRAGHVTRYLYNTDGTIFRVTLPQAGTEAARQIQFSYTADTTDTTGKTRTVSEIIDAEGNRTTFKYAFNRNNFSQYVGGTTWMVNALGVKRTESNDAEFVQWRLDNGYYQTWDAARYTTDAAYRAQADDIRTRHTTLFTYDAHGALLTVTEPRGFTASYAYDANENLITVADANADAITRSDDQYFRDLRRDFGYVQPITGQGKLVAELTAADVAALKERFTTHLEYDGNGNLVKRTDNDDNVTTFTYTSFNKLASQTAAMGNALVTRDDAFYQAKRTELGYAALVANLSAANKQALLNLFTTFYSYDAKQNLIELKSPGGDLTRFAYDAFGNLTKKTVFLDANDLVTPAKQQVTQYFYDAFGQNIKTIDAEGNTTFASYDHFGNRTTFTDANGGVTTYTYDNDNQLLTATDPEGFVTANAYDSVGNRISVRDANGHTVVFVYSRNNLLVTVTDPSADGNTAKDRVTRHTYDVVGNHTSVTDANGNTITYSFREDNRLVTVTTPSVPNAAGQSVKYTTSYAYDGVGNRISVRDNNGNLTQYVYDPDNLLVRTTDAVGQVTQYSFDANLNRVSVVMGAQLAPAQRQVLRFSYDEEDQLTSQTDALGNTTRYAYDAPGNRISTTDALGRVTDFTYDRNNRLLRETRPAVTDPVTGLPVRYTVQHQYDANNNEIATTDENGHVTRFSFDRDNRLVMVEDGNGIKTVFTYDSRHNRTSVQIGVQAHMDATRHVVVDSTENAQVTTHTYDEFNQRVATTDGVGNALITSDSALYRQMRLSLGFAELVAQLTPANKQALKDKFTERYAYDKVGNYTQTTDHLGRSTSFAYDALNRQVSRTDALNGVTRYAYDGNGNRVKETDALNHATTHTYEAVNRRVDTTDALGVVTHRDYDSFGNLVAQTRAAGTSDARTTTYVYDLDNRLVAQTDPEGHGQAYEYDAVGNRLKVTDARGFATKYVYDALNRNIKIIDPLAFETRFEYDGVGNRITLVDARGGIQRLTYDAGNRYIQTTDAEGRSTRFTYDVRGNRITQTTAFGTPLAETTAFEYDAENNLRSITGAEGNVTRHGYDQVYNRTQTIDGNGHATSYAFDALNREIRITDAEGGLTRYSFDAVGNQLTQTDALNRVTTYVYDARNQLISQFAPDGVETRYAYDRVGNRVTLARAANTPLAATTTFVYNGDDQLVSQTDPLGHTTSYQYDPNHNRTLVTDPRGNANTYVYDADNRVTSITDPLGNVVRYTYDGNGNRVQVVDARGFTSTTYYNADNEVVLSVDNEGFATSFAYDANGNVTSQTLFARALALPLDPAVRPTLVADPKDQTTRFAYDRLNRLTQRTDGEGFVTQFVYDAVGNRLQARQALDLAASSFAIRRSYYDGVNREVASLTAEGYLSQTVYDAVGNRTRRTQFDQKVVAPADGSRPTPAAGDPGRATSFVYDANNRLTHQTSALGISTDYVYDARGNRTAMKEASGTPDARTTLFTFDAADRYVETTNALGVKTRLELDENGNVVSRREAFGTTDERLFTFTYDADNRVTRQTNALGVITTTSYDANGNVVCSTQAFGLPEARTESFSYDRNNRLVSGTNAAGETTTYAYDAAGNRVRITQAPGRPEERSNVFVYDRDNRLFQGIDGVGTLTEYHYDGAGNKIETVQAKGVAGQERHTLYVYDKDNRLAQVTDPEGGVTRYEYDVLGNQTRITDANGGVQQNTFDAIGRVVSSLSAGGVLTRNTYDRRDNILSTTQSFADLSDARTTTYAYDLLNRQTRSTDGEGFSTSFVYDVFGNQTSITRGQYLVAPTDPGYDASKAARAFVQSNAFVYDAADRMLSLTDAEGNVIAYSYDAVGNRLSMTEASGTPDARTTRYAYDLANRLTETRTPEGGLTRNTYDQVGDRVAEDQLQSGDEVSGVFIHKRFEHDRNGHLTAEIDPFLVRTEYTYDRLGNLLVRRSAVGTTDERTVRMEYDRNNRKTADIDGEGNRTSYAYDAMGNRVRLTDARGKFVQYFYDGANQLFKLIDPEGFVNTFRYDAAGNQVEQHIFMVTSPDRIVRMEYDRANRLTARVEPDGTRTEVLYDGAGNKTRERTFANTSAPRDMLYQWDRDNRLVRFTDVDGTVNAFTYDRANNKLSETIVSATDPNSVRATFFQYDLNNRRITETFDPNGLNIVLRTAYDKVGNTVAKTDGNGHVTRYAFDLNNRLVVQTDALGNTSSIAYDKVGNQVALTDARGNTTTYEYDGNNRKVKEIQPAVQVFTIEGGFTTVSPTIKTEYDGVGNEVQVTDPNGFVNTRYFDGNNRMVAEVSADDVLCEYSYNASGDEISKTTYMTRLSSAAHDPAFRPTPPAGDRRVVTYEYDLLGRLTKTTYPPVEITTLTNTGTNSPVAVKVTTQVTERKVYDAFGNEVETYDRNGNRAVSYYDAKNRKVAMVDATGFLVEWDYDAQGNQTEQRVYSQPLDPASVTPALRPTPPAGPVFVTSVRYDAASRKVEEKAPQIEVFDPLTQTSSFARATTAYTYDDAGNELTKTLAVGTPLAVTEYSYYDAANRRIAVINSGRVLNSYQFDANGNVTLQKRFLSTVPMTVDLSQLGGSTDFAALVSANPNADEATSFVYDALNRVTDETDLMGPGAADDLTKHYAYDATHNRTFRKDEDAFVTKNSYDGKDRMVETITPDESGTLYQYDAAGNQVLVFTGKVANVVTAPTDFQAILSDNLDLQWRVAAGRQTWVVYDTVSRTTLADYANRTDVQFSFDGAARATIFAPVTGTALFFRFVAQDGAGNLAFSAEETLAIPPRFHDVAVASPDPNTLEVTARFDAGTVNPTLQFHSPGNPFTSVPFVLQADGSYKATIDGVSNAAAQALSFKIVWEDAAHRTYESAERPFEARAAQVGITSEVSQGTVSTGTTTSFNIHVETRVPTATASGLTAVQARWRLAGSNAAFAATAANGIDSGFGYFTYSLLLGDTTPLAAGDYEILLDGVRTDGTSEALDRFTFTVGDGATPASEQSLSWTAPAAGTDQLVIIDGQSAFSERRDGRVLVDSHVANDTSTAYDVFYSTRQAQSNTLDVTSTAVTQTIPDPDPTKPPHIVITGYDVGVTETLSADEAANVFGDLHLAWRPAGTGIAFENEVTFSVEDPANPNVFSATLPNLAAGQYDLKVFYHDSFGHEVIVQWRRVDTADATTSFTDRSHIVVARETGGFINRDAQGVITLDPGLYVGPLDTAALLAALSLTFTPTGQPGGSQDADGLTTGYFVENQFNALDAKIATNENDGLWRTFGVDGNGNRLETRLYGDDRNNPGFIITFTTFDARGRKLAEFGAPVFDPASGTTKRPVRSYTYDVFDKTTSDTDALGNTRRFEYNALGTKVKEIDPFGRARLTRIDLFGRETATVTELGHTTLKFYDLQGRLITERDPLAHETRHTYDAFDRKLSDVNALGDSMTYAYDQRDRLVREEQPQGHALTTSDASWAAEERQRLGFAASAADLTDADKQALIAAYSVNYAYDGRNDRTSIFYPLGQRTDEIYDGNGRMTESRLYLAGSPAISRRAFDAYGNTIAEVDAEGRAKSKVYGGFGRLVQDIDEDGNRITSVYDVFGRVIREFDASGKDVRKTYDDAGRVTTIQDFGTGVSTTYTYDLTGKRLTEVMTGNGHDRNMTYQYDALGQMVRWADAVTGLNESTFFDAEGNRVRAFTDSGYDPLGQNTDGNPNFRYVDHVYSFDDARRVFREVQRTTDATGHISDTLISEFGYDAANNRVTWNNAGTLVDYVFDANGRAVQGDFGSTRQAWTYDAMGNVLTFRTLVDGNTTSLTTNTYNDANRTTVTVKDDQTTTQSYDRSLRITQTVLRQRGKTYYYNHSYFGDGRERNIVAFGDAFGNSTSTYDTNKVRASVNLGQGDGQNRPEIKTFAADNEGHIVFQFHDDGKSGTPEQREYVYAGGNPWAETGHGVDGVQQTLIDTGKYNLIQNLGSDFPGGVLTYTTRDGDSLMSIAAQMYGNPSLWFVIADANGLNAGEQLKAGRTLTIPNSVKTGNITAENHKVYSESEIVGSTLPNLKTPPPPKPKKGCGSIIMIIIIVVIAVVASFFIGPLAGVLLNFAIAGGAAAAGTIATLAAYAVAGAIVAAVASIVQQGLFIALGYQDSFSWKQVGNAAIAGAITGAAQGLGAIAEAARVAEAAGKATEISSAYAQVASAALKASGVAVKQILDGGKITSWTSIAAAGIGQYMSADVSEATKTVESAELAGDTYTLAYDQAQSVLTLNSAIQYATPWVQLAETYVRHDGKLTPMDWANAAGSTLAQAAASNFGAQGEVGRSTTGRLLNSSLRLGSQLLVAGALRHYDRDAAQSYFENAVGQEVGQFIGDYIGQTIRPYLPEAPRINVALDNAGSKFGGSSGNETLIGGAGDDSLNDDEYQTATQPSSGNGDQKIVVASLGGGMKGLMGSGDEGVLPADTSSEIPVTTDTSEVSRAKGDALMAGLRKQSADRVRETLDAFFERYPNAINMPIEELEALAYAEVKVRPVRSEGPTGPVIVTSTDLVPQLGLTPESPLGAPQEPLQLAHSSKDIWPFFEDVHSMMNRAASPDANALQEQQYYLANKAADDIQDDAYQFTHVMRGEGVDDRRARALANLYARFNLEAASRYAEQGDMESAYFHEGLVRHLVQDASSDHHRDPNTGELRVWRQLPSFLSNPLKFISVLTERIVHVFSENRYPGDNSYGVQATKTAEEWFRTGTIPAGDFINRIAIEKGNFQPAPPVQPEPYLPPRPPTNRLNVTDFA